MFTEQRIRSILFYLSLLIFLVGLPFILSFALGYKFNPHTFKFTKTGIILLKTQPAQANVFLSGKLLEEKTPATLHELIPGNYNIKLELENYYPWAQEVHVEAGKVSRLEKIILFPLRPNIVQLNEDNISSFLVDTDGGSIYYINQREYIVYRSDLSGNDFQEIAYLPQDIAFPLKYKPSPDKEKLLCYNNFQIVVVYLWVNGAFTREPVIVEPDSDYKIIDAFWHSDNYHLVVVTQQNVGIYEVKTHSAAVGLVSLNKRNAPSFYDQNTDTLYFMDAQKAEDGKFYDNAYKLEIGPRFNPLQGFINPKTNE